MLHQLLGLADFPARRARPIFAVGVAKSNPMRAESSTGMRPSVNSNNSTVPDLFCPSAAKSFIVRVEKIHIFSFAHGPRQPLCFQSIMALKYCRSFFWNDVDRFAICANLQTPLEAGTPLNWECVLRTGTANWKLNFVPASAKATAGKPLAKEENRGSRLSFFVLRNVRECWFFDIYIQGSKKVQL
jgi:hypothetical protein